MSLDIRPNRRRGLFSAQAKLNGISTTLELRSSSSRLAGAALLCPLHFEYQSDQKVAARGVRSGVLFRGAYRPYE